MPTLSWTDSRVLRRHLHLFALGALTLLTACGGESGSTSEWPDFFTLEDLVPQSELIAVVALIDERSETVEVSSPTSGDSGVFREDSMGPIASTRSSRALRRTRSMSGAATGRANESAGGAHNASRTSSHSSASSTSCSSARYEEAARAAGRAIPEATLEDVRAMAASIGD